MEKPVSKETQIERLRDMINNLRTFKPCQSVEFTIKLCQKEIKSLGGSV